MCRQARRHKKYFRLIQLAPLVFRQEKIGSQLRENNPRSIFLGPIYLHDPGELSTRYPVLRLELTLHIHQHIALPVFLLPKSKVRKISTHLVLNICPRYLLSRVLSDVMCRSSKIRCESRDFEELLVMIVFSSDNPTINGHNKK